MAASLKRLYTRELLKLMSSPDLNVSQKLRAASYLHAVLDIKHAVPAEPEEPEPKPEDAPSPFSNLEKLEK